MSTLDLAAKLHVSRQAISKWETGDTKNLKMKNLVNLVNLFNLNIEWLVFGKGVAYKAEASSNLLRKIMECASKLPETEQRRALSVLQEKVELLHLRDAQISSFHSQPSNTKFSK